MPVIFTGASLIPGEYEGFVVVQPSQSGTATRTPYWHAAASGLPRNLTVIYSKPSGAAGTVVSNALMFRVTDESGIPVSGVLPRVEAVDGGGAVDGLVVYSNAPFVFGVNVRLGPLPGLNVFRVQAGEITKDVTVIGQ